LLSDGGELGFAWQSYLQYSAPTETLEPEESTSYTAGIVFEPSFLEGLSIGLDYWNIEIDQVIGFGDMNNLFYPCLDSVGLTAPACDAFTFFGVYNLGVNWIYPGDAELEFGNLGTLATDGVDVDIAYAGSNYNISWSSTFTNGYEQGNAQTGTASLLGTANGFAVYPDLRMNFGVGFFGDNWSVDYFGRYISATDDLFRPCYLTDDCKAEAIFYSDVVGSYTWDNIMFNLGFRNITDEDAPRFHSAFNANTEPGMYDVVGRAVYAGFKVSF